MIGYLIQMTESSVDQIPHSSYSFDAPSSQHHLGWKAVIQLLYSRVYLTNVAFYCS